MTKTAKCGCGALTATVEGEPKMVLACHCTECQRRTGAPFGVGVYYPKAQVTLAGAAKSYTRPCSDGRTMTNHFCPSCGTTLFWEAQLLAGMVGIASGCFNDPDAPKPAMSVYEDSKQRWVQFGKDIPGYARGRAGPQVR